MLHSVRFTGGTGFGDFRDFRRLIPNAGSSYGNTALLEHGGGIAALPRRDRLAPGLRHPSQTGAGPGG